VGGWIPPPKLDICDPTKQSVEREARCRYSILTNRAHNTHLSMLWKEKRLWLIGMRFPRVSWGCRSRSFRRSIEAAFVYHREAECCADPHTNCVAPTGPSDSGWTGSSLLLRGQAEASWALIFRKLCGVAKVEPGFRSHHRSGVNTGMVVLERN